MRLLCLGLFSKKSEINQQLSQQNRIQTCECFASRNNSRSTNHIYCSPNSLYIHKNLYRETFNVYYTYSLDPAFLTHIHTHTEWGGSREREKEYGERL